MKEGTIFLLAAAVVCAFAAPSAGQTLLGPDSQIKFEGDVLYNSNVTGASPAFAALSGLAVSDETYTPSIDINYIKQLGLESFTLSGQAGYDFYQRNTILNRERMNVLSGFGAEVADCQLTLRGTYARAQSDLEELSLATIQNIQENITGELQGACNQSGKLVPSLSVTQSWANNSVIQLFTSDYRSIATQGSILYKNSSVGDISLLGQYTDTQFPHRLLLTTSGIREDGYKLFGGGLQLEHHFGSDVDFSFSLSETSLRSDSGFGSNFDGLTYDFSNLNYRIGSRLRTTLSFSRKTNPSNLPGASYSIDQIFRSEADYQMTTRLLLTLGASDTKSAYEGLALVPGTDLTKQSVKSFFGSIGFNISPQLSVHLTANQDQRHADVIGYSYASTRFGLSISQAF